MANVVVAGAITVLPLLNERSAPRPAEQPFWASIGVVFAFTIGVYSAKNLVPMNADPLFDLAFLLPIAASVVTYAVLKTMREGFVYDLNRRYYRLRPPE